MLNVIFLSILVKRTQARCHVPMCLFTRRPHCVYPKAGSGGGQRYRAGRPVHVRPQPRGSAGGPRKLPDFANPSRLRASPTRVHPSCCQNRRPAPSLQDRRGGRDLHGLGERGLIILGPTRPNQHNLQNQALCRRV